MSNGGIEMEKCKRCNNYDESKSRKHDALVCSKVSRNVVNFLLGIDRFCLDFLNEENDKKMINMMKEAYKLVHGKISCPRCGHNKSTGSHVKNYEISTQCNSCSNMFVV